MRNGKAHVFDEKNIREDVKLNLPNDWKLRVLEMTSGDSGEKYWVQYMENKNFHNHICICNCPRGLFHIPVEILGLYPEGRCKHVKTFLAGVA
jgi:hypothetical protein